MSSTATQKLSNILACPLCRTPLLFPEAQLHCPGCGSEYPQTSGAPILLAPGHPLRPVYEKELSPQPPLTWKGRLREALPLPEPRLWTRRSLHAIAAALTEARPDDPDRVVVNLGAGVERVYQQAFAGYHSLVRVGLPHSGHVDAFADAHQLPIRDHSVDLFLSASVLEHVQNPEQAVAEMGRVVRHGGLVYAEIPFLRAYHMVPHDYQRYTISGIEALFDRHGFDRVEKGICSGPFTAWGLLFRDAIVVVTPTRALKVAMRFLLSWLVQPFKHLDYLVEEATWATYQACNFYYLGRRRSD